MPDLAVHQRVPAVPRDTTAESAAVYDRVLRSMGIEGRARMTFELSKRLREVSEAGVRYRHPEYTRREVQLAAIRLAMGDELFAQVYPGVEIRP